MLADQYVGKWLSIFNFSLLIVDMENVGKFSFKDGGKGFVFRTGKQYRQYRIEQKSKKGIRFFKERELYVAE